MADSSYNFRFVNQVVLPGDTVAEKVKNTQDTNGKVKLKLGPGLRIDKDNIVAYKCGVLREKNNAMFWIDTDQKRVFINLYCFILVFYVYYNEIQNKDNSENRHFEFILAFNYILVIVRKVHGLNIHNTAGLANVLILVVLIYSYII